MRRLATLGLVIAAAALTATGQGQLTITTNPALPTAIIGQPYPVIALQAANSSGNLTWSFVESGPPGFLALSAPAGDPNQFGSFCFGSGSCSGAAVSSPPATPGIYTFGIQVSSPFSQFASQTFTLVVENPLQISPNALPLANANQSYTATLQGIGGTGNFVWSIPTGPLPPGISLADPVKGVLSGTAPGINGVYPFTVQLMDQVTGEIVTQSLSITVVNGVPTTSILTTSLPNAVVNQQYPPFQFMGTGANPVWSVVPGTPLPQGFSLSPDGLLTGIGVSTGAFSFQIQLINSQAPTLNASQTYSFFVTLGPLSIVEGTLPAAASNVPYSTTLTPSLGLPPYTWSLGVGTPSALSISSSGVISGTLTTAGSSPVSFPVLVSLKDSTGTIFTRNYTLVVSNTVSITTTSLPNGGLNVPYFATLTAIAGQPPDTWSVSAGSLPPGLTLNSSNGQISGTPTALGSYPFTVKVTDSASSSSTKNFTIVISQPLTISTTLIGASLNQSYSQTLTATGGTPPVTSWNLTGGNLPTGLLLNSSTGAITGTPTAKGSSTFTVRALDSAGQTATQSFTLTVADPVTISAADFTTSVGTAVSQTVTAGGGVLPYTFSVSTHTLPDGLVLAIPTGVISGAAGTTGTFHPILSVTDSDGRTATTSFTITVNSLPLTIVVPATPGSGQQPGIGVSTSAPATGDITGTLTLAFASSVGGTDNMIVFQNGFRLIPFTIAKGSTTTPNVTVITGTVAGTITLTASVTGNLDVVKTIVIPPTVPVISSVALQQVTGGLNVVVEGYSNTREVSSGSFTFTVSSGNTLSQAAITVPLTSAYATWFTNTTSNATGGQFKLTVPFSVTQGSAAAITKVSVTLTNAQGASAAVTSP
jgi:hypothetical protein